MIDILLIEDDDAHAKIVQRYLGVIPDYTIHRCRTLQEGLASVKENKYTVLLLDLSLPDSTFQETFKKIEETAKRFPVVVLTSLDEQRFAQKLLKLGAQDYLSKGSLSSENLNRSIRYAIERKSLQQKLRMYSKALEKKNDHLEKMVSERTEKLSKSEKKYRSLVQLSPISILIMNSEGQLCYANPEFQRRFGYKRDNKLSNFFNLFADTENSLKQAFKDQLKQKLFKPIKYKATMEKTDGQKVWTQITVSPIADNHTKGNNFLILIDDISELKVQEQSEREKKVAEKASKAKTDFLTNVSHEIRTPLSAIIGYTDLLKKKNSDFLLNTDIDIIRRNSQHLLQLVNDLLDLSKIESGQLEISTSRFSLSEEVNSIIEMIKPLTIDRPIRLHLSFSGLIPKYIDTDLQKFRQILINLINNAIKYTEKGKVEVNVRVKYNKKIDQCVLYTQITDTGPGIRKDLQGQLFQPFSRGNDQNILKKEGMGVGLALSRKLALSLGGDISLQNSEEGKGCTFEVCLPIGSLHDVAFYRPALVESIHSSPIKRAHLTPSDLLKSRKILVAEDAKEIQHLVKSILQNFGAHVTLCDNGLEVLDALSEEDFDLVIMDVQMPKMNGIEAVKRLRKIHYPGKILALTAHAFKTERDRCLAAGFDNFVSKPFNEEQLLSAVTENLPHAPSINKAEETFSSSQILDPDMKKAVEIFYSNLMTSIEKLKTHAQKKEWEEISRISHRLKGSSACFNYKKISHLAKQLEELSHLKRDDNLPLIQNIILEMSNESKAVQQDMKAKHLELKP